MAKLIEYDVEGVEESTGGTGVKIKPGVHPARIARCVRRETKRDGTPANDIEVALDVGSEYDWVFTYIGLSPESDWKLAEFIRALGLKDKGKLDPDKQVGKIIRVKINPDSYGGEYSPNAGRLMQAQDGDEELIGQAVSETSARSNGAGPEPDEPVAEKTYANPDFAPFREGQPDPTDPDTIVGSYEDWEDADLLAEVEDRGLTLPGGRGSKKNKAIQALRDEDAEVAGAAAAEPEGAADDADPTDDYDSWDLDQLKTEWEERQMGDLPSVRGRNAEARLIAQMVEAFRADDAENPFNA